MLPQSDIAVGWDIEFDRLRAASDEDVAYGGFATREYSFQLVVDATWEGAVDLLAQERETVARIVAIAADEAQFDELAKTEEDDVIDEMEGFVSAPDLGVRAVVTALCASGCVTAASCRGHPGQQAWAPHPVILLTADRERAHVLEEACRGACCGIASTDDGRLKIVAPSIEKTLSLADALIAQRARFETLPLPAALARARGLPTTDSAENRWAVSEDQERLF